MLQLTLLLVFVSHFVYTFWKIKKDLHILQLNSYFNKRYFAWLREKFVTNFKVQEFLPLAAMVPLALKASLLAMLVFAGMYIFLFVTRSRYSEKKPLVFTSRATRVLVVSLLLLVAVYVGSYFEIIIRGESAEYFIILRLAAVAIFSSLLLSIANLLLLPLEEMIQRWYFNDAAKIMHSLPNLTVVGITGSFGKTTTKHVLHEILRQKFMTLMTPASFNTTMGVCKTIRLLLKPMHQVFVVEMSAKKPGDIKELCDLTKPKFGLITAIGEQHLETFKTFDAIKSTKNELFAALPSDGVAFFNFDDESCRELFAKADNCKKITYGIDSKIVDYRAEQIKIGDDGSSFVVRKMASGKMVALQTKLLGKHNVYNILGAVAIASEMGVDFGDMIYPIRQLRAVQHRLELKNVSPGISYIDDSFNSNPVGSRIALEVLAQFASRRKIIVTPGMVELGSREEELNRAFGEHIATVCDYVILVGRKQTAPIYAGLKSKDYSDSKLYIAQSFTEANQHLQQILCANDIVLFENDLPDNYNE